jgi:hypothetical protein
MQFRSIAAAVFAAALAFAFTGAAQAQAVKQIQLTEKQVQNYIAAQKTMPDAPEKPNPRVQAQLEDAAKKAGFASYAEFGDVAANIAMIVDGIDPKTKAFTEPVDAIKKELAEVQADRSMPAREKQAALKELNDALKDAQPVQFKGNIELVKKYYDKLAPASQ